MRLLRTRLSIAGDTEIVVDAPGRYDVDLVLVRWSAAEGEFVEIPIDVEPREFEVRAGTDSTLVTVTSRFVETPR